MSAQTCRSVLPARIHHSGAENKRSTPSPRAQLVDMCDWLIRRLEKQWALEAGSAANGCQSQASEAGAAGLDLSNKHFRTLLPSAEVIYQKVEPACTSMHLALTALSGTQQGLEAGDAENYRQHSI